MVEDRKAHVKENKILKCQNTIRKIIEKLQECGKIIKIYHNFISQDLKVRKYLIFYFQFPQKLIRLVSINVKL